MDCVSCFGFFFSSILREGSTQPLFFSLPVWSNMSLHDEGQLVDGTRPASSLLWASVSWRPWSCDCDGYCDCDCDVGSHLSRATAQPSRDLVENACCDVNEQRDRRAGRSAGSKVQHVTGWQGANQGWRRRATDDVNCRLLT